MNPTSPTAPFNFINGAALFHPKAKRVFDLAMLHLAVPHTPAIVIYGASGVGKEFIRSQIRKAVTQQYQPIADSRYDPAPFLEVDDLTGNTHWSAFYVKLQKALGWPRPSADTATAQRNIIQALELRRSQVVLIDETHHLMFGRPDATKQAEVLKSLLLAIPRKLVLFATHKIGPLACADPQLIRRSKPIHFRRYDRDNPADFRDFKIIVAFIEKECSPVLGVSLSGQLLYVYARCDGLIGRLRTWLENALIMSHAMGSPVITQQALILARINNKGETESLMNTAAAEAEFAGLDDEEAEVMKLGSTLPPPAVQPPNADVRTSAHDTPLS